LGHNYVYSKIVITIFHKITKARNYVEFYRKNPSYCLLTKAHNYV
jgi:hypothetical protein